MAENVALDTENEIDEFVILANDGVNFDSEIPRFVYSENVHTNLRRRLTLLEKRRVYNLSFKGERTHLPHDGRFSYLLGKVKPRKIKIGTGIHHFPGLLQTYTFYIMEPRMQKIDSYKLITHIFKICGILSCSINRSSDTKCSCLVWNPW